jgi:hypothetical protein
MHVTSGYGDSGGPLLVDVNGTYVQVGTVSYGSGCARENKPGVYGRVSAAHQWIQDNICELSSFPPSSCASAKTAQYPLLTYDQNPPPADKYPLGVCQGDCDYDTDCGEGLFCFQRLTGKTLDVPGCLGQDNDNTDFCVWEEYRSLSNTAFAARSITNPRNDLITSNQTSLLLTDVPSASPTVAPAVVRNLRSRIQAVV